MARRANTLDKLLEQEKALQEAIREAKKREAADMAERDAERCRIIGAAVVAEMKDNPAFAATLEPVIAQRVTKAKDRLALGLGAPALTPKGGAEMSA